MTFALASLAAARTVPSNDSLLRHEPKPLGRLLS